MPTIEGATEKMNDLLPQKNAPELNTQNPAADKAKTRAQQQFVPMSVPVQKLEVPDRPGWHRHWFRSDPGRLARAQRAYYQFVSPEDVDINNLDIGGDSAVSGNTDMGSRVSVISGEELGADGQPNRLVLMECPDEYWELSQKVLSEKSESIAEAIRGGKVGVGQAPGESAKDAGLRYVKDTENLFTPLNKRAGKR